MQTIANAVTKLSAARSDLARATHRERREAVSLIAAAIETARPVFSSFPEVFSDDRSYAADHHDRNTVSWKRALLIEDRSGYEGMAHQHSFRGPELYLGADGLLWEADADGYYAGLVHKDELYFRVSRTFRRIGAREVARRYGGVEFVRRLAAALEDLARDTARQAHEREQAAATASHARAAIADHSTR